MQQAATKDPAAPSSPVAPQYDRSTGDSDRGTSLVARLTTLAVVLGTTLFVLIQLDPGLIIGPNMDVGGDNAAHIAAVYYLIHDLLPHFHLSGWDPQWFGGFPLYVFYFPLPALLVAVLTPIFHYAVAFKLVTISGTVAMPTAAYLFGRLAGFARPTPALMAAAMLPFLFNTSYTIDGGNIASTLAGEFSFTLSMAFMLVFIGVLSKSLQSGRLRWLAALLFAATVLCHVVPAIVAAGATLVLTLLYGVRRSTLRVVMPVVVVGALLAAFWLFRFGADLRYSSSMGYDRVPDPFGAAGLLPHSAELSVQLLAVVGMVFAFARHNQAAITTGAIAIGSAIAFIALPSGLVYNGRWLPFWFLSTALLAAYAIAELGALVLAPIRGLELNSWLTPLVTCGTAILIVAAYIGILPVGSSGAAASFVPSWISWNYSGYQAKSGWPEFERIISMLDSAGARYGCGNLDYEYSANVNDTFGSTIVEMSFPYWTGGCIDSAEGLYYESSTSTPFHFLDQSEVSVDASNPIPDLPYESTNLADGIKHLQLTGVKYFLANSPEIEAQAAADSALTAIASTPEAPDEIDGYSASHPPTVPTHWVLYRIDDSALVTPLQYQPVVEPGMSKSRWLSTAISWYQDEADWPVLIAPSGPSNWKRLPEGSLVSKSNGVPVGHTTVSDISYGASTLTFHVTQTGVPVLVKVPYFPNWQASGATGPWPVTPNLMVVVPTSHSVSLVYGTTTVDWLGRAGTALGFVGLIVIRAPTPIDPAPSPRLPVDPPFIQLDLFSMERREDENEADGKDAQGDERAGHLGHDAGNGLGSIHDEARTELPTPHGVARS